MDPKKQQEILDKQDAEQAPPVSPIPVAMQAIKEVEAVKKKKVDEIEREMENKEKLIKELAVSDAWKVLKEIIEGMRDNFKANLSPKINGEFNFEKIGIKAVIADQLSSALQDIINIVEQKKIEDEIPQGELEEEEAKEE